MDDRSTLIQVAQPISAGSEVCVTAGAGSASLHTQLGQDNNSISIPAKADTTLFGIDLTKQISTKLDISVGYARSGGSGSNFIYRNNRRSGTLQYEPNYHQLSASLKYQRRPASVWKAGFMSSKWDAHLRGISLKGDDLGINIKPFSERIDFNADSGLSVSFFHLGMQRQVSDKWRLGWRYKLVRIESDMDADYVGRAFFGLINVTGNYNQSILATRLHDLELSAQYALKKMAFEMRIEQIIPIGSGGGGISTSPSPSAPADRRKSTGGTSFSLISSYAF